MKDGFDIKVPFLVRGLHGTWRRALAIPLSSGMHGTWRMALARRSHPSLGGCMAHGGWLWHEGPEQQFEVLNISLCSLGC